MTLIPDVSEWQSSLAPNWTPTPDLAGIKRQNGGGIILRAGYGLGLKDRCFDKLRAAARANGYSFIGIYHYVLPGDQVAQADAFCRWVGPLGPGEIPIDDLEDETFPDGDMTSTATAWLNRVDAYYGLDKLPLARRSWLYTGDYWGQRHGLASICNTDRQTWVAAYGPNPPSLPHVMWQSTNGTIGSYITSWAGCGKVDTSYTSLSIAQLAGLAFGGDMSAYGYAGWDAADKAAFWADLDRHSNGLPYRDYVHKYGLWWLGRLYSGNTAGLDTTTAAWLTEAHDNLSKLVAGEFTSAPTVDQIVAALPTPDVIASAVIAKITSDNPDLAAIHNATKAAIEEVFAQAAAPPASA